MLNESEIRKGLQTLVLGRKEIYIYDEIDSTNNRAFSLAGSSAPEGTVVIAETQSSGKGRLGRTWVSVQGKSLSFSVILRPEIDIAAAPGLTLVIAVALSDTLHNFAVHNHVIKWPNDILINNKKISGILTELKASGGRIESVIAGVGINISSTAEDLPAGLKEIASSVYGETGIEIDRTEFFCRLLLNLELRYNEFINTGLGGILPVWKKNSDIIGRMVSVNVNRKLIEGRVTGITEDGGLEIETGSGMIIVASGEITML